MEENYEKYVDINNLPRFSRNLLLCNRV